MLDRSTPVAAYYQFSAAVRQLIESGRLQPGYQLPTVSEICRTHRLSRTTVQRALGELQRGGLIVGRRGLGTFVAGARTRTTEVIFHDTRPSAASFLALRSRGAHFMHVMDCLRDACAAEDRCLNFSFTDGPTPSADELLAIGELRHTDSFIVHSPHGDMARELAQLSRQVPTVSLLARAPGTMADAIVSDPAPALRTVLERRLAQGRRRFMLIDYAGNVYDEGSPYEQMRRAFRDTLDAAGLSGEECHLDLHRTPEECEQFLRARLSALPEDAVVVTWTFSLPELPDRRLDCIAYTESLATRQVFQGRYVLLYLEMGDVAHGAARLLEERRSGRRTDACVVTLAPEVLDGPG